MKKAFLLLCFALCFWGPMNAQVYRSEALFFIEQNPPGGKLKTLWVYRFNGDWLYTLGCDLQTAAELLEDNPSLFDDMEKGSIYPDKLFPHHVKGQSWVKKYKINEKYTSQTSQIVYGEIGNVVYAFPDDLSSCKVWGGSSLRTDPEHYVRKIKVNIEDLSELVANSNKIDDDILRILEE